MTREQCRKTAEIFNALADGKTITKDDTAQTAENFSESWRLTGWTIAEPPPAITEHGRTYVLQPLPEKPKLLEVWASDQALESIKIGRDEACFSVCQSAFWKHKFVQVLEDENGK